MNGDPARWDGWYTDPKSGREGYVIGSTTMEFETGVDYQTLHRWRTKGLVTPARAPKGSGQGAWYWVEDIPLVSALQDLKELHRPETREQLMKLVHDQHMAGEEAVVIEFGGVTIRVDLMEG